MTPQGAPRELFDLESHHWASEVATREWLSRRGVRAPMGLEGPAWSPPLALRQVIDAWVVASGRVRPDFPSLPDQRFMVASGLARVRSECLRRGVGQSAETP